MDDRRQDVEAEERGHGLRTETFGYVFLNCTGVYEVLKMTNFDAAIGTAHMPKHTHWRKTSTDPAIFHDRANERTRRSRDIKNPSRYFSIQNEIDMKER